MPFPSVCFDTRELHHLPPFLGLFHDELAKVGGRPRKRRAAEVSKPRFYLGVSEGRVDLLVELVNDLSRRPIRVAGNLAGCILCDV